MMKKIEITDRDRQMLELLAKGSSNRSIAESLGYREGTMRVYLHGLYRKLGVGNKTSAVIWYLDQLKVTAEAAPAVQPGAARDESFGDMALRMNPFAALGAMAMFLGAYGRVWEVAHRMKGATADAQTDERRRRSRQLWEAMLKGDFAYGKQLYDDDLTARLLVDSPSDCVLLACLLRIGGYTKAAERVMTQLVKRRKGRVGISARKLALLTALRDAFDAKAGDGLVALYKLATESAAKPVPRQVAMVALFWAFRARKEHDTARGTANALWAEAESVRQHLQAMGERPLDPRATVPNPSLPKQKLPGARTSKDIGARLTTVA